MYKTGFSTLLCLLSVIIGAGLASSLLSRHMADEPPPIFGKVPIFVMHDSDRKEFGSTQLNGKAWVLNFFFARCQSVCPALHTKVRSLYKSEEAKNIQFVSISVDPVHDSPEVLEKYAKRFRTDNERWHFLRADKEKVHQLAQAIQLAGATPDSDLNLHSTRVVLVDKDSNIRGFYQLGNDPEALLSLKRDLKNLDH